MPADPAVPHLISLHPAWGDARIGAPADDDGSAAVREAQRVLGAALADPPGLELTSSCTHALEAAALLLDIGPDDEVVVPAFTFPSTSNAFLLRGARVRFADVDPISGCATAADVDAVIGPRTRVVVAMHYGGANAEAGDIAALCAAAGAVLVEDAAHGLFGRSGARPLGRFGALGCLSFHRTKNVSCWEGGALVINDPELVAPAQIALDKGTNRRAFEAGEVASYEWSGLGSSWRLAAPLAGLLVDRLANAESIQARRRAVSARYAAALSEWSERTGVALAPTVEGSAAHLFWVVLPDEVSRAKFVAHCAAAGVQSARHYGSLPDSAYGRRIRDPRDGCPNARRLGECLSRLPLHHELRDGHVDRVLEAVTSFRP